MFRTARYAASVVTAILMAGVLGMSADAQEAGAPAPAPAPSIPPTPAGDQTLPGGASQLQETHADWRVVCAQQLAQKACLFSQQQTDTNTRQLVLGIELKPTDAGTAEGTLVLPFGLAVTSPVTLQIDETGGPQSLAFRTCLPVGCLVPLAFDASTVAALRSGTTLAVTAIGDGGQEIDLTISLNGFSSAFDRTVGLMRAVSSSVVGGAS